MNLFDYIFNSLETICKILNLSADLMISSDLDIDSSLQGKERVFSICKYLNTEVYINAPGGIALYDKGEFQKHNIELEFIKMNNIKYKQFNNTFVPNLSIIDVLMFNGVAETRRLLQEYSLV